MEMLRLTQWSDKVSDIQVNCLVPEAESWIKSQRSCYSQLLCQELGLQNGPVKPLIVVEN